VHDWVAYEISTTANEPDARDSIFQPYKLVMAPNETTTKTIQAISSSATIQPTTILESFFDRREYRRDPLASPTRTSPTDLRSPLVFPELKAFISLTFGRLTP
jgi:hypothetical protein